MNWKDKLREAHRYSRLFDFEYLLDVEYGALNSYLIDSEKTISDKQKELEKKIENWKIDRKQYEDAPEPFEIFESDIVEFSQFSILLNNSFFVTSYSIFEKFFNEVCIYCRKEEDIQKTVDSIKRKNGNLSYIESCKVFIEKVVDVCLDNLNVKWLDVEKYRYIRNAIVHNNGVLKESVVQNEKLILFIKTNESIEYDENLKTVAINSIKFISGFTELVKVFYSGLLSEIYNQRKKAHNNTYTQ